MAGQTHRRARGEGGLRQRSDGYWAATVEIGHNPETGRRQRREIVRKTQAEALAEKRRTERQRDDYGTVSPARLTVGEWLHTWVEDVAQVKPSTRTGYRSTIRLYLEPTLGRIQLARLTPDDIRRMHATVASRRHGGRNLSPDTVRRAHRVLSAALTAAVHEGKLVSSPAGRMRPPRAPEAEAAVLNAEQTKTLMQCTWNDWDGMRWALALLTGMRQGEILGLEWARVGNERIDLSWQLQRLPYRHGCGGTCSVTRAGSCPRRELDVKPDDEYEQVDGGICLIRPKSDAGKRVIPMIPEMRAILAEQARRQRDAGLEPRFVFTRRDGRPVDYSSDNAAWHRALVAASLPSIKLHSARHTAATLLLEAGVDGRVVQQIAGHSTVAMTRRYQHVSTALASEGLGAVAALIGLAVSPSRARGCK